MHQKDLQAYNHIDQRLHLLSQVLAKANRTYVPKIADDSHTNLYFDLIGNRIIGRWVQTEKFRLLFGLDLASLSYKIICKDLSITLTIETIGKTIHQIETEMESQLHAIGLNPNGFCNPLHFKINTYDFRNEPVGELNPDDLELWKYYRSMANYLCNDLLCHAQVATDVRIWPHHFDTGVYFELPNHPGIGFGLAMSDVLVGAPYFYMAAYPKSGMVDYSNVPRLDYGKWITKSKWKGAVLPLTELNSDSSSEDYAIGRSFIMRTFRWFTA